MSQWILNRKEIDGYRNGETITIVGRRRRRFVCVLQFDSCARKMAVNKFSTLSSCNGIAYLCVIDLGHFRREVVFVTQMTADNHVWMNVQWCCCCCWCRIGTSIQYNVMWTISELCCLLIKQEVIYLSLSTRLSVISHFIRLSCVQICIAHQQCICHCCWMSSTKKTFHFVKHYIQLIQCSNSHSHSSLITIECAPQIRETWLMRSYRKASVIFCICLLALLIKLCNKEIACMAGWCVIAMSCGLAGHTVNR